MKLENKYVIGCLVMWYEVEMFPEYIDSCIQMTTGIENGQNITFHFCLNYQEYLEKCSIGLNEIAGKIDAQIDRLIGCGVIVEDYQSNEQNFYNIAKYRRDLNYKYCDIADYILWGETDSLWPAQTLQIIEQVHRSFAKETPKFVLSFASRINWDSSWNVTRHPLFESIQFQDNDEWVLNNEASEKSYMTIERMGEINELSEELEILELQEPKADGSCLVISSELIKSGINIPHALLHCGEDESFLRMAKLVMGQNFKQYLIKNILRVHNRRHAKKRMYIQNENNPRGFCDERKGDWWKRLEEGSKYNLNNLRFQRKFIKIEEVINQK